MIEDILGGYVYDTTRPLEEKQFVSKTIWEDFYHYDTDFMAITCNRFLANS